MLRYGLALIPVLTAAGAVVGLRLSDRPMLAVVVAGIGGLVAQRGMDRVVDRRVKQFADDVRAVATGDVGQPIVFDGKRSWRQLASAVNAVGSSFQHQLDQLARERERAERLLEQLPLAVLLFTRRELAYANPAARDLFAVPEHGHRTPLQVLGVPALADAVGESAETGCSVGLEVNRGDRILSAHAAQLAAGEVALVVTDLTHARHVEQIRRDFVVNASHELKTPVAGMRALADSISLALRSDPIRAQRMITRLRQEADRLSQMVRNLLDLARLEDATAHPSRSSVDVAEVVRHQIDRFEGLAAERGVVLACDCAVPATVVALPEDIRLIIDNLVENAVRYNRDGGRVDVAVRRRHDEVVVEVTDTGAGIPVAELDRIFERFYRIDKARSRALGGTGLGLSLVRNAVERQGGRVSVDSVLGQGSVFRVVLPVEGTAGDGG